MATTYVSARDAIITYFNTQWTATNPTIPAFYENTASVDLDVVSSPFVTVGVDFTDAVQSDLDLTPVPGARVFGKLIVKLFAKEGSGSRQLLVLTDFLDTTFRLQPLSGVQMGVPRMGRKQSRDGWYAVDVICDFTFWTRF